MKLELNKIIGYLPYGLKAERISKGNFSCDPNITEICIIGIDNVNYLFNKRYHVVSCKPILRPLSDLTKSCLEGGLIPIEELSKQYIAIYSTPPNRQKEEMDQFKTSKILIIDSGYISRLQYWIIQKLFEWHFDIYGLIEAGLAIDINTLKP
jgi:hypothetical protein